MATGGFAWHPPGMPLAAARIGSGRKVEVREVEVREVEVPEVDDP